MKRSSALHIADQELDAVIDRMLSGPQHPDKVFVQPSTPFCELYTMAAGFRAYFKTLADEPFVCLCALDKTVVAAALLASLAGGPALVLPYAFTPAVLSDLHRLRFAPCHRGQSPSVTGGDSRGHPPGTGPCLDNAGCRGSQTAWRGVAAAFYRRLDRGA